MTHFDPDPNKPYAKTQDGETLLTEADANAYMQRTLEEATPDEHGHRRGKRITIINPSREDRILRAVERHVKDGLDMAMDEITHIVHAGEATLGEVKKALRHAVATIDTDDLIDPWMEEYPHD